MTILEQKVDAIARSILANDTTDRNAAIAELAALMQASYEPMQGAETITPQLLIELGVPEHIKGSKHLAKAICAVVENEDLIYAVTCELYPLVAETFASTASKVERTIRHAIELSWDRGDLDVLNKYFGNAVSPMKGKPTNSEFIARCANIVRDKINNTN